MLCGYLGILGASSVQSCCTLSKSASYSVFLWHISQIQTCLCVVVGPGFVSTSTAFMRSSGSAWPAFPKMVNRSPIVGGGRFRQICTEICNRRDSSTTCRLCCLEPKFLNTDVNVYSVSTPGFLPHVKSSSECSRSRDKHMVYSDIEGAMLSTGMEFRTDFTHIFQCWKMQRWGPDCNLSSILHC